MKSTVFMMSIGVDDFKRVCFLIKFSIDFVQKEIDSGIKAGSSDLLKTLMKAAKKEINVGGKNFFKPMRWVMTGEEEGVDLDILFSQLSLNSILKRLEKARK